ncbi:MAG: YabP/YqfC family sporulation protein [Acutalibacteraceae bacterium]
MDKDKKKKITDFGFLDPSEEFETPHIELCSNKAATVEGCRGIIEYCETTVRINCGNVVVKLCGDCLGISSPSTDTIAVRGNIVAVEFST